MEQLPEDYKDAFIKAYTGETNKARVREFLGHLQDGTDSQWLYNEYIDCYTEIMDRVVMFHAGISYQLGKELDRKKSHLDRLTTVLDRL